MTVLERLGFEMPPDNALRRLVRWLASTRLGAWLFSKWLHHLDLAASRITQGRVSVSGSLAGLPIVELETRGARSGKQRTSPLVGIPIDGTFAVIGSGWGQKPTPGWVYNLRADPGARLQHEGREVAVVAREAADDEVHAVWNRAQSLYSGFSLYPARASHRDIAVFLFDIAD